MTSLFVTGTDTGVGKTILTAALVSTARAGGHDVVPMKPVQTGCEPDADGEPGCPDLDCVLSLAGMDVSPEHKALMSPFRYRDACSPHLAAKRENRPLRVDDIVTAYAKLTSSHDAVVVEGAGGLLVPLNDRETMRDLAKEAGVPHFSRLGAVRTDTVFIKALTGFTEFLRDKRTPCSSTGARLCPAKFGQCPHVS